MNTKIVRGTNPQKDLIALEPSESSLFVIEAPYKDHDSRTGYEDEVIYVITHRTDITAEQILMSFAHSRGLVLCEENGRSIHDGFAEASFGLPGEENKFDVHGIRVSKEPKRIRQKRSVLQC